MSALPWWKAIFARKATRALRIKRRRGKLFRPQLERLENRIAPAVVTIDADTLTWSSSTGKGVNTLYGSPYAARLTDGGRIAEFDISGSLDVPAGDTLRFTGSLGRGVSLVVANDVNFAGTSQLAASGSVSLQAGGAADLEGDVAVMSEFSISAAGLEIGGHVSAGGVTLASAGLLDIDAGAGVAALDGGSLAVTAETVINSGELDAGGCSGGRIDVSAVNFQNAGSISADGASGAGGAVQVSFTGAYIETSAGLIAADGTMGAGGSVTIDGGSGHLFTSGRQEARGTMGGSVRLHAGQIDAVAAAEDVSGTVGAGGSIAVLSVGDSDYSGTLTARGVTGGGVIEVSAGGTLTYAGSADAGATAGPAGSLRLDPKNLVISASTGTLPQYNFTDPNPNSGGTFGAEILPLSTGNIVITDPTDNFGASNAGAVYVFNGLTGGLISTLVGSSANDKVGSLAGAGGVVALTDGNFVVDSSSWGGGKGAVTWGSGTTGVSGAVSGSNSLVGSSSSDNVGYTSAANIYGSPIGLGVTALTNGSYVVASTNWNGNRGAVTLGSGTAGVSGAVSASNSLVGSNSNDAIGGTGVVPLSNGDYVVDSTTWNGNRGAVTWGSGTSGVTGAVSSANSLVGTNASDQVGYGYGTLSTTYSGNGVFTLSNGNYLVLSNSWNGSRGAVTWGSGTAGVSGAVSSANSLVGSSANDEVGNRTNQVLNNGNYLVISPNWNGGAGAVTWGSGTAGVSGAVSSANSLVGSVSTDNVGNYGIVTLHNGNYVVRSPSWSSGKGAATWGSAATGIVGAVSASNSLVGSTAGDSVGTTVTPLSNNNYVVSSTGWSGGKGAATWGNGATGITGTVSSSNSLVGSTAGDGVGGGVTDLGNGNYVVSSFGWNGGRGAATWANGSTGLTGAVSASNSLVGSHVSDGIGHVTVLTYGNYVVTSLGWNGYMGEATWANGTTGITGTVSSSNSLVGSTGGPGYGSSPGDEVGSQVIPLSNGNYVVESAYWNSLQGAVTWGSGAAGVKGQVSSSNSLVGSTDGTFGIYVDALSDGNYVVAAPSWNGNMGAATWGSGTAGVAGQVSAANSLVGSHAGDEVGLSFVPLNDGNYVIDTYNWNSNTGAVTWANGSTGVSGQVSSSNSFVGSRAGDLLGNGSAYGVQTLGSGYVIVSPQWNTSTGAVTWFDAASGRALDGSNTVDAQNSLIGQHTSAGLENVTVDSPNQTVIAAFSTEGTGRVTAGFVSPTQLTFAQAAAGITLNITPAYLARTLNTGTAVVLQADTDITISSPITVSNPNGKGGNLTLDAGRSIIFSASTGITTGNGNLTLIANEVAANGVVVADRDSGLASITDASSAPLNVGTGTLTVDMGVGAGSNTAGSVSLGGTITAGSVISSTTTTLTDNGGTAPSIAGQPVSFTVAVAPVAGSAVNGDTVSIEDASNNDAVVATPAISNGTVTFTIATLSPGTHNLIAVFNGNAAHLAGQSGSVSQVVNPDSVVQAPNTLAVDSGANATFTAFSALPAVDSVQWQVSTDGGQSWQPSDNAGQPDSGANSDTKTTLSFTAGTSQNGYEYRAAFTNAVYTSSSPLLSTAGTLTVYDIVTTPPMDQAALIGQPATFSAASAYATDTVQWQVSPDGGASWSNVAGATSATLPIGSVASTQDGDEYRAVFTPQGATPADPTKTTLLNGQSVLVSNPAFLSVDGITAQPTCQDFAGTVMFSAASARPSDVVWWYISSDGGKSYQRLSDGGAYMGSATDTLSIVGPTADMLSNEYEAVFTNAQFTLTTNQAALIPAALWDSDTTPDSVTQGAATGEPVGITAATNLNKGSGLTFSLAVDAGGRFAINPTTGVVSVANGASINYLDGAYPIEVVAADNTGDVATGDFTIAVVDAPPAVPIDHDGTPNSVVAQAGAGTSVGITAFAADPNPVSYSLTEDASGIFAINPNTGVVTVANGSSISYPNSYTIGVEASDGVGGTSTASFTIHVNSSDPSALNIGGYSLLKPVINGTTIGGTVNLPFVGNQALSGTVLAGQYNLSTTSLGNFSIDGITLSNPVFTLNNSGLTVAGSFTGLPLLGNVTVTGAIADASDFDLGIVAPIPTLAGFTVTEANIVPSGVGYGLSANFNLPVLGSVTLAGTIQDISSYSLTATLPRVQVDGVQITNAAVQLTDSGLSLSGTASLPLIGTVSLAGVELNGQYTLSASVPNLALAGYTLTGASVTLGSSGISLTGTANLPLVNTVSLTGAIQDANDYSLSATLSTFSLGGFSLSSPVVTLSAGGVSLSGTASLPLVGSVPVSGSITASGGYSLTASLPSLSIGGFSLSSASVTLSSAGLSLGGMANLPIIGIQSMTGLLMDASHYSVSVNLPSLSLGGGFSLTNPRVTLSGSGLTVVGDATLPVLGAIPHLQGSIQDGTHFSLSAPVPSLGVGLFTFSNATVTLSAVGAAVSLSVTGSVQLPVFGNVTFTGTIDSAGNLSVSTQLPTFSLPGGAIKITGDTLTLYTDHVHVEADVSVLQIADAHFSGNISPDGDYELDASASLNIGGFSIPVPSINGPDLKLINGQLDIGFDYDIPGLDEFLPSGDDSVSFSGTYSLNGQWSLTATASFTFTIGPVVVTTESLTLTSDSLTLSAQGSVADLGRLAEGEVSMTIYEDGSFQASVTIDSTVAGFSLGNASLTFGDHNASKTLITTLHGIVDIPLGPDVTLDGYWDANGNYDFKGTEDVVLGGLTLAQAQFDLNKTQGLTFSADCNFGVIDGTVSGTITPESGGGFSVTSNLVASILGGPHLSLSGNFDSSGNYDFKGTEDVVFGPLTLSQDSFELSNTKGLTFSDSWNYGVYVASVTGTIQAEGAGFVATVDAKGTMLGQSLELKGNVHSNGQFDLSGSANIGLAPLAGITGNFDLSNNTGSTVFMFSSAWSFGPFASSNMTGTITGNNQGYDIFVDASGAVFGQTLELKGHLSSSGKFDFSGSANVGLQPIGGISAHFDLSNSPGPTIFMFSAGWSFGPFSAASMTGTITGGSQSYDVSVDAKGSVFGQSLELKGNIQSNGNFDLSGSASVGVAPMLGLSASFDLSNGTGPTVFKFSAGWSFGPFSAASMTGTITGSSQFDVSVDAKGSIFGQSLELKGDISSSGFDLSGSAKVGLQPLASVTATFDLSNKAGSTVFMFSGGWSFGAFSSASMSATITGSANNFDVNVYAMGTLLGNTIHLGGYIYSTGAFDLQASDNMSFFGVSLTYVAIDLSSMQGFSIKSYWSYPLFSGTIGGTIANDGEVKLSGNGFAGVAGFGLSVSATVDLDPAHNYFYVDLGSTHDVYVATVSFDAKAQWSSGVLPQLSFTGHAAIGGILAQLLSGSADFTIGTSVIQFDGTMSIPNLPSATLQVNASIDGAGDLTGIPSVGNIFSLSNLSNVAAAVWHGLGAGWSDVAKGLNQDLQVSDQQVEDLLKAADASAADINGALTSAFNWSSQQLSNFLGGGSGVVSSVTSATGYVTGKKHFSLGVPEGSLVFFDANKNGILDPGEPWGYTTSAGQISFEVPSSFDTNGNGVLDDSEGQWVVEGGTDLTTGLAPAINAVAPASWNVISPLTTLVSYLAANDSLTIAQASAQVLVAMGLPGNLDLSNFDPIPETLAGNAEGPAVELAHASLEDTTALVAALFRAPSNAPPAASLTSEIVGDIAGLVAQATSAIDLTNATTIAGVIQAAEGTTGTNLNASVASGAASVIAACNQQLSGITPATNLQYLAEVAHVKTVAQATVANDLASAAAGQSTIGAVLTSDTGSALAGKIAATVTPPRIILPLNNVVAATSASGAPVDFGVEAYDLAGEPLTVTSNYASGSTFPLGITTVTSSVTDGLGNTASATFTITVAELTAPTITLPANMTVQANASGGANVTLPAASATDPVDPNPSVTENQSSGFFPVGVTPVTVTATDSAGNTSTGIFTVTVVDSTAPTISVPANIKVEANITGGALVTLPQATATDIADPNPVISEDQSSGFFALGTTTVHVSASDASDNISTGSYTVTVVDTTPPVLSLPANLVVEANATGGATVSLPQVSANDTADSGPVVSEDKSSGFFPLGTTTVDVTATDASGNKSTGSYTVTVVDTTPPTITAPANLIVQANTMGGATVTLPTVSVTDPADADPTVSEDHESGFFPLGTTLINVTATDASGNTSAAAYTITVVNTSDPTFTPAASGQVEAALDKPLLLAGGNSVNPLSGYYMLVEANTRGGAFVALPTLTASDAADAAPLVKLDHSSGFFPLGTTTVEVTATDSSGNSISGSFTVTVEDTTPPMLAVPSNLVVEATVSGGGANVTLPGATATDIADPSPVITYTRASGFFPMGLTTVQVKATDGSGNFSTGSFTVDVVDTTPPTVTAPTNLEVQATSATGAMVTLPTAMATDLVDPHPTVGYDHSSGFFPVGTTLVTVSGTDASGNTGKATFTVTVDQVGTQTSLQSSGSTTSTYGDSLTFTVSVSSGVGAPIPDGETVTLEDASNGNAVVGTGVLENGSATVSVAKLNKGAHSIVADYDGDADNAPSHSGSIAETVQQRQLFIKAVTNTKSHDGLTSAAAVPVVVGLQSGDFVTGLSESYADSGIGFGKTLIPSGVIQDGNGGNNYAVSFVNNVTGVISITLNAPASPTSNIQPTLSGMPSTANGDSSTVTLDIYRGSIASGAPVETLQGTVNGGGYSIEADPGLMPDGTYTAQALQASGGGRTYRSNPTSFVIDTSAPSVSMTLPANFGNNNEPTLKATAADNPGGSGLASVQFQIRSSGSATWTNAGPMETAAPFAFTLANPLLPGSYQAQAIAVDNAGNQTVSTLAPFTITAYAATASQNENGAPAAVTVKTMLGGAYSDPDSSANTKPGIGVLGLSGAGAWQYSTNGSTWLSIGNVSTASALLLTAADYVRFVPTQNWSGQASLLFLGWDGSQGIVSSTVDTSSAGGTSPFSTLDGQLGVNVNPVPRWNGTGASLASILPGTYSTTNKTAPAGSTVASIFGPYFHDDNSAVSVGVGVTSVSGTANGTWQYSTNGGASWVVIPAVSSTSALLLAGSDLIRFVPKTGSFAGMVSLSALAWDGSVSSGNPPKFSSSAFSSAALTATAAVNRAPALSMTTLTEPPMAANTTGSAIAVSSLLTQAGYSDADGKNLSQGIAIESWSAPAGALQYQVSGGTWQSVPAVSQSSALLLPGNASLRFMAGSALGTVQFTFAGWDQTQGVAGQLYNASAPGGATAISTASATGSILIKETPSWSATAGASLAPLAPGSYSMSSVATPAGNTISSVFGSFFVDANPAITVGIAVAGTGGNGTWQYSLNGGAWTTMNSALSKTSALLLSASDSIRFVPNTSAAGTATLTVYAWDGSVSAHGKLVNLTQLGTGGVSAFSSTSFAALAAANDAPTLGVTALTEAAVAPNTTGSALSVATLLSHGGYSDPDGGGVPRGLAVAGASTSSGSWQYLLPGGSWKPMPSVLPSAALLLPSTASLRLMAGSLLGPASLTFVGWDQTQGAAGQIFDLTHTGGVTAFSSGATAISVAIKQAPTWSAATGAYLTSLLPGPYSSASATAPPGNTVASVFGSFFRDATPGVTAGIAIAGLTGTTNGTWQYSTSAGVWLNFATAPSKTSALLLSAADLIRFVPKNNVATTATLLAYAWDGSGGPHGASVNLSQLGTGGVSPFSATTLSAACIVNTAPSLADATVTLSAVNENSAGPTMTAAALLADGGYVDPDGKTVSSGIAITSDSGAGAWQWLKGSTWTPLPAVPTGDAFLLPSTADVRFDPADNLPANTNGTATLVCRAWDQTVGGVNSLLAFTATGGTSAFSATSAAASMPINFVRQAPRWLSGISATLTPVLGFSTTSNAMPNPAGNTVASIFGGSFNDTPGIGVGIAISGQAGTTAGVWQYSSNGGGTWLNVPAVAMTNALLLSASDMLRFVPSKSFSGIVSLTAYAWDGTNVGSDLANLTKTGIGGSTPFSGTSLVATCLVNSAPVLQ